MQKERKVRVSLRKIFLENAAIKLIALLISVIVWFNAVTEDTYVITKEVPVEYINFNKDSLFLLVSPPQKVEIILRGKGKSLLKLNFKKIRIFKDLGNLRVGIDTIYFRPEDIILSPEKVEIIAVRPHRYRVLVDKIRWRRAVVKAGKIINNLDDLIIKRVRVTTRYVKVFGPTSIIRKIGTVYTQDIVINEFPPESLKVALGVPDTIVRLEPESIIVVINGEKLQRDTLTVYHFNVAKPPGREADILTDSLVITFLHLKDIKLTPNDVRVYIEADTLAPGLYEVKPIIKTKSGVKIVSIEPPEIQIRILP